MRAWFGIFLAAGCASEPIRVPPATIGAGTVTKANWSGGDCPRTWSCAGTIALRTDELTAQLGDGDVIARGVLTPDAYLEMRELVAQISVDEPTGMLPKDGADGPGPTELWVETGDALRVYVSNGFAGDLGNYIYALRDSIAACSPAMATLSTCTPQP